MPTSGGSSQDTMPKLSSFKVTETRMVRVDAITAVDAARIAAAAFLNGQGIDNNVRYSPPGVLGNTVSKIRATDLEVREDW